jgi:A/G-specific adenine glycosylase
MPKVTEHNIIELQEALLDWYGKNGRDFPWRKKKMTHYQIVIAEVLLQRTKAKTVASFYTAFISNFPGWKSIAKASMHEIEESLCHIGLQKQRGVRLKNLALEMDSRKGKFPREREELESIPFLGQYIANAVELMIFRKPSPLMDVNMARVLERYFGERKMADIRYDPYLQGLGNKLVNHPDAKTINWAVLDFAAMTCKPRNPTCSKCELNRACSYHKKKIKVNKNVKKYA